MSKTVTIDKLRNFCLVGSGGSGKTSLAEAILYVMKITNRLGNVQDGNTVCDYNEEEIGRKHPDIVNDREAEDDSLHQPAYGSLSNNEGFDEEATQVSDLSLKSPLPLGRPQMAESRKVKGRKGGFSLFGIFRKRKK